MKKILLTLSLIILGCFSFSSFGGNSFSARTLNELCEGDVGSRLSCVTYIHGYMDGVVDGKNLRYQKKITVGTFLNIFKKEMKQHPEVGDEGASTILAKLLKKYDIAN